MNATNPYRFHAAKPIPFCWHESSSKSLRRKWRRLSLPGVAFVSSQNLRSPLNPRKKPFRHHPLQSSRLETIMECMTLGPLPQPQQTMDPSTRRRPILQTSARKLLPRASRFSRPPWRWLSMAAPPQRRLMPMKVLELEGLVIRRDALWRNPLDRHHSLPRLQPSREKKVRSSARIRAKNQLSALNK